MLEEWVVCRRVEYVGCVLDWVTKCIYFNESESRANISLLFFHTN